MLCLCPVELTLCLPDLGSRFCVGCLKLAQAVLGFWKFGPASSTLEVIESSEAESVGR